MSRTEQLGLPIPRKLKATIEEFHHVLEEEKVRNLDKCLDKSLKSIYRKLECKSVKQKPIQKKRKTDGSKDDHEKWLINFAKPKKIFLPEPMERSKGVVDLNRVIRLSQPRYRPCSDGDMKNIPEATLKYVATERILGLAQPRREKFEDITYEIPRISFPISPAYAAVKSLGIDRLSLPSHPRTKYHKVYADVRCSYSPVSRGALQYEPSDKIRKLSKPKSVEENELSDPYAVKKKALRKLPMKKEKIFKKLSTPLKVTPKFEVS